MNKNFKRNSALILAGLAVGAVAGMLLAPKSGKETRSRIRGGVNSGYNRGLSFWNRLRRRKADPSQAVVDDEGIYANRR